MVMPGRGLKVVLIFCLKHFFYVEDQSILHAINFLNEKAIVFGHQTWPKNTCPLEVKFLYSSKCSFKYIFEYFCLGIQ